MSYFDELKVRAAQRVRQTLCRHAPVVLSPTTALEFKTDRGGPMIRVKATCLDCGKWWENDMPIAVGESVRRLFKPRDPSDLEITPP